MTFTFRPAIREKVPLLIGVAGGTGSGKTYSALRIAKGIVGDKRFCVIDTEAGRGKHYADQFTFDHGDFSPPFTPERYTEAIVAADKAGYPVIIVDSMSHVWAGDGGCLDMQEDEHQRMGGRDAVKMASWIKPKTEHKHMVAKLLQIRAHLILCFRAEPKVEMKKIDGKTVVVAKEGLTGADGWFPICEKSLPFELTVSLLLLASKPGIPLPIKLQEQHRGIIRLDRTLDESTGTGLATWAAGGSSPAMMVQAPLPTEPKISAAEAQSLRDAVVSANAVNEFRNHFKVAALTDLPASKVDEAWAWVSAKAKGE
jgi:hypothetical protein